MKGNVYVFGGFWGWFDEKMKGNVWSCLPGFANFW